MASHLNVQYEYKWEELGEDADSPEVMTTEVDPSIMADGGIITDREGSELPVDMSEWTAEEVAAYNALRSKRKKCCIGGCTHRSLPIAKSYHQLPVRNEEIWKKWVEIIRWSRNDVEWSPTGDAAPLVCSRHFPDSDFISYEASSRVRLSHTAIPVYYIDPPEGTLMDPRFSDPPPVPSFNSISRQKEAPKQKKPRMDDYSADEIMGYSIMKHKTNHSPSYVDNLEYDIEEVNEDSYDNYDQMLEEEQPVTNFAQIRRIQSQAPGNSGIMNGKSTVNRNHSRLSAPPSLVSHQNHQPRTQFATGSRSKLPALIKADNLIQANKLMIQRQSMPNKPVVVEGGLKSILNKEFQSPLNRTNTNTNGQKHKIGLAKCRLIIQTLENQMKIAEMRLAEQLDVPVQVVRGVWNMRDSLKDKL